MIVKFLLISCFSFFSFQVTYSLITEEDRFVEPAVNTHPSHWHEIGNFQYKNILFHSFTSPLSLEEEIAQSTQYYEKMNLNPVMIRKEGCGLIYLKSPQATFIISIQEGSDGTQITSYQQPKDSP